VETSNRLDREQKSTVIGESRRHEKDTGSIEVQVSLLTRRIGELSEHFRAHSHDHAGRRGLVRLVGERRRLLQYLNRHDVDRYRTLVARLGLRK
jgi:small subunit ribosomal protein S15